MSKIVCDVCGTSYPDSASQCPICGCVRPGENTISSSEMQEGEVSHSEGYTYVKGGRFSRSNVRKRSKGEPAESETPRNTPSGNSEENDKKNDKGLIAAVCLLLLAIIAVVIYIVIHFFSSQPDAGQQQSNNATTTPTVTTTTEVDLSCTEIVLSQDRVELLVGESHLLAITTVPENTTDAISYVSSNSAVATVSADGSVQAVAAGEATITITCGQISAELTVICSAPVETTEATQTTEPTQSTDPTDPTQSTETTDPTETTQPSGNYAAPYRLNRHINNKPTERDATIIVGESFQLKLLDVNDKVVPVVWTVEKTSVCSVNGNTIKAKAVGTTTITTVYEGVTYTCLVRVKAASK